jgi:hypothetical protein
MRLESINWFSLYSKSSRDRGHFSRTRSTRFPRYPGRFLKLLRRPGGMRRVQLLEFIMLLYIFFSSCFAASPCFLSSSSSFISHRPCSLPALLGVTGAWPLPQIRPCAPPAKESVHLGTPRRECGHHVGFDLAIVKGVCSMQTTYRPQECCYHQYHCRRRPKFSSWRCPSSPGSLGCGRYVHSTRSALLASDRHTASPPARCSLYRKYLDFSLTSFSNKKYHQILLFLKCNSSSLL